MPLARGLEFYSRFVSAGVRCEFAFASSKYVCFSRKKKVNNCKSSCPSLIITKSVVRLFFSLKPRQIVNSSANSQSEQWNLLWTVNFLQAWVSYLGSVGWTAPTACFFSSHSPSEWCLLHRRGQTEEQRDGVGGEVRGGRAGRWVISSAVPWRRRLCVRACNVHVLTQMPKDHAVRLVKLAPRGTREGCSGRWPALTHSHRHAQCLTPPRPSQSDSRWDEYSKSAYEYLRDDISGNV